MPIQTNANPSSRGYPRLSRIAGRSRWELGWPRGSPMGSSSHHTIIISVMCGLFRVEFWKDIAADLLRLVGGAVSTGFIAAVLVAVLVLLLGVLPWQDALVNPPAFATEWWFRPAMVLAAYAIMTGAAVWNRWKVGKDG